MAPARKLPLPDDIVKELITEIKARECIWNQEHEQYNDRFHVMTSWKQISNALGLPEEMIKGKWKNLRDLFKKEAKRCKSKADYTGKWRHFSAMWFLHRPGDFKASFNDSERLTVINDSDENYNQEFEGTTESFIKFESPDGDEALYEEDPIDPIPGKRKKFNNDDDDGDEDYDVMFLKSLTPYFKQLEPMRKLVLRSKMQDMLMNEIAAQNTAENFNFKRGSK